MTDVEQELAWWDEKANDLSTFKQAVWDEDPELYDQRVEECIQVLEPRLRDVFTREGTLPKVLDLGCGAGRLTIPLAQRHPKATIFGVDISPQAVHLAELESQRLEVRNTTFFAGDGRSLPKLPRLHGAYSMLLFQHLPHAAVMTYLIEVAGALTRGSPFVFQHAIGGDDAFLSHQVSEEQLERWCTSAGLTIELMDRGVIFPPWVWVTARKP